MKVIFIVFVSVLSIHVKISTDKNDAFKFHHQNNNKFLVFIYFCTEHDMLFSYIFNYIVHVYTN